MKVSVVIPIYNVEPYIGECLSSVCEQTYKDLEIICVHDAGQDGSIDIAREYAKKDARITIIENETNQGLSFSRNVGLDNSHGEYVYFLDSDDKIVPEAIEELCSIATADGLDAAVFCADFIYDDESLREKFSSNPAVFKGEYPYVLSGLDLFIQWMKIWDWMPSQPRFFYRRDFLVNNKIRYIEGMLHEDEIFTFDVLMNAQRIRVVDKPYFIRRFRDNSIMTTGMSMRNVFGCYRILQHVTDMSVKLKNKTEVVKGIEFYREKIASNAKGKLRSVQEGVGGNETHIPILSVVIPVYNVEPYLAECLDSVLAQSMLDYEVICVDDGSTDKSPEIMEKYEGLDPRIHCYYEKVNRGQSVARNIGLEKACGKYVYMLDADDKIAPGAFETLTNLCEEDDLDIIGFENQQFADSPEFQAQADTVLFSYEDVCGIYQGKDGFITCVKKDVLSPSVPTFVIKRKLIEDGQLRFVENIKHEDIGFILEMFLKADKVRLLHKKYLLRRFRPNSTVTGGFAAKQMEGYLKSWQKYFDFCDVIKNKENPNQELALSLDKWKRDVLGRIRMLYTETREDIYHMSGGYVDETTRRILEVIRETTSTRARAEYIMGVETCSRIEQCGKVYICGTGQYGHRMVELIGALDVEIKGIISKDNEKKTFRGFPVVKPEEFSERDAWVVMAHSHYQSQVYHGILDSMGIKNLLEVKF